MQIYLIYILFLIDISPQFTNEDEEANNIQDLSKNVQESIGIFPIGEIIRKANFPYLIYPESEIKTTENVTEEPTTTEVILKTKHPLKVSIIKTLLKGTQDDIRKLSCKAILRNLKYLNVINLPSKKKAVIWETVKKENPVFKMNTTFFKNLHGLFHEIPENDYIFFNITDWDLINFFGKHNREYN